MLDALRANDSLPREARARLRDVTAAVQRLEHRLGRPPRAKEVANALDWPLAKFHRVMVEAGAGGARAGDEELEHVEDTWWSTTTSDEKNALSDEHHDPFRALQQRQRHAALHAAFDALEEVERYVMEAIYDRELPLRDIGAVLGVSESRVSQIAAEIVTKLRRRLREW
jgi:RNA polymerase sigma factor for flagellar operon FliA